MVPDPYRALNLPHTATSIEIKKSYRELARKYHPDRHTQKSDEERADVSSKFAKISAAYDLLSDPRRKAQYDHIYKYGGYDDVENESVQKVQYATSMETGPRQCRSSTPATEPSSSSSGAGYGAPQNQQHQSYNMNRGSNKSNRKRRKSTGIGYACTDPLAFLWTNGRVQSQMAVAGIQIPSRLQMASSGGKNGGGVRFAFSSGHLTTSPTTGVRKYTTQTTQFCHGKKFTRTETTTIHPDGRREVVIEGNDFVERRSYVSATPASPDANHHAGTEPNQHQDHIDKNEPWYTNAFSAIKEKLTMCYNPCMVTSQ